MNRDVLVSFLKPVVLLNVMEIVSPDYNSPFHFLTLDNPCQDSATNTHIASERALFVYVSTLCCLQQSPYSHIITPSCNKTNR